LKFLPRLWKASEIVAGLGDPFNPMEIFDTAVRVFVSFCEDEFLVMWMMDNLLLGLWETWHNRQLL
jgi:hypothetical protein